MWRCSSTSASSYCSKRSSAAAEAREMRVVESGPGWTPMHEVKFLLWLAARRRGGILGDRVQWRADDARVGHGVSAAGGYRRGLVGSTDDDGRTETGAAKARRSGTASGENAERHDLDQNAAELEYAVLQKLANETSWDDGEGSWIRVSRWRSFV